MCVVSMIGDHFKDKFQGVPTGFSFTGPAGPSKEEFEALKKEVLEMKALLLKAKEYDKRTGQPDCEMEEKVALLKQVAKLVGVDLAEVFAK